MRKIIHYFFGVVLLATSMTTVVWAAEYQSVSPNHVSLAAVTPVSVNMDKATTEETPIQKVANQGVSVSHKPALNKSALSDIRLPQFSATEKNRYTVSPELISLNFTSIRVRELLQIIAQFTKLNFVITDNVKGEMSIHLRQVPWTQALDVILKSQNLGERQVDNIIYIAPVDDLLKQQIAELEAKQRVRDLAPLEDRVIRLNYASAEDIQNILVAKNFSLLSARGTTSIDKRTNSLWIRDTPAHIKTVTKLIKKLDYPVKQILIEARVVDINRQFERALGARFGLTRAVGRGSVTGTLDGANALATGTDLNSVPLAQRLNFDEPVGAGTIFSGATPGSIGLALSKLGPFFVDMELSALEAQNDLDIISSPRLITSNQHKAYIETGEQIPYQNASSSGATSVSFADALLKLEVTPQITPDNRVILDLTVSNNSPGTTVNLSGGGQAIGINTEQEQSRILLNDNQTVVLGGVYKRQKNDVVTRIPFISKIPLLGHLFRSTDKYTNNDELLIFLTPHIIQKPGDASSSY
ncbi:MAG: type IV pilus secretin PilQ [Gammaproteobacteria bacterium CG_4_10_14_0_8_um_filter_38_16]|nr:MAG: type IV pilus secretin PilQ [Gammaproteobacteria bacterium CG_4_10_14_0_8_um_filter_38_16]PJA03636.1 MAG: type IV pilus secretin PilQ [Gammaproteobacteria bacterium CG_4_10_14_0_2_um_filter_38_22]PJB10472.1 MAG: type IV pilus secretin PilQ [Gammaproteobacteria bacterium CG_4_9_14_3_um_filter_38_9]